MSDLKEYYQKTVIAELQKQFGYKNIMEVPRVLKVTLNMGVGEAVNDRKAIESAGANLARIAGQKAIVTHAKKAVASFKIRADWPIGCKVTLRGNKMYDFIRRLVDIAIPRIRDFRGLNHKSFDGRGNYSFGVKELIIFPEIDFDKFSTGKIPGLDICITTSAKSDDEAKALLKALNFPIK